MRLITQMTMLLWFAGVTLQSIANLSLVIWSAQPPLAEAAQETDKPDDTQLPCQWASYGLELQSVHHMLQLWQAAHVQAIQTLLTCSIDGATSTTVSTSIAHETLT